MLKVESWRCKEDSYALFGADLTPKQREMHECETLLLSKQTPGRMPVKCMRR